MKDYGWLDLKPLERERPCDVCGLSDVPRAATRVRVIEADNIHGQPSDLVEARCDVHAPAAAGAGGQCNHLASECSNGIDDRPGHK